MEKGNKVKLRRDSIVYDIEFEGMTGEVVELYGNTLKVAWPNDEYNYYLPEDLDLVRDGLKLVQ